VKTRLIAEAELSGTDKTIAAAMAQKEPARVPGYKGMCYDGIAIKDPGPAGTPLATAARTLGTVDTVDKGCGE
jgi:hypothetical protein